MHSPFSFHFFPFLFTVPLQSGPLRWILDPLLAMDLSLVNIPHDLILPDKVTLFQRDEWNEESLDERLSHLQNITWPTARHWRHLTKTTWLVSKLKRNQRNLIFVKVYGKITQQEDYQLKANWLLANRSMGWMEIWLTNEVCNLEIATVIKRQKQKIKVIFGETVL